MGCQVNAVVNDNQYLIAPSLQQGFIDKDSGLLLAAGIVTFYRDVDHIQLKPVFTISGPPDAPIFTQLPNPLILSAIGTFVDPNNNQDIIPYYLPYDDEGNVDLYYITVYNSDIVLQFTRDHYPTVQDVNPSSLSLVDNYVPNGQFLFHLDLPESGQISEAENPIAYGGWRFDYTSTGTSINFVTFPRFNAPTDSPEANPRYACRIRCTMPDPSDSKKDLLLIITDVNFLQGQPTTFQFTAYSNDGGTYDVELIVRKIYGITGSFSATTEEVIQTFTVTSQIQNFTASFTVSSTIGKTLGPNNDDEFQFVIRWPLDSVSDISVTDVIGVDGSFLLLDFPDISPEQQKEFAFPASFSTPAYDGSDSGKYLRLFNNSDNTLGFIYNDPVPTGTHIWSVLTTPPLGFLLEDGSPYAVEDNTDNTVTAYPDLFTAIFTSGGYAFGTGQNGFINSNPITTTVLQRWNRNDVTQPTPNYDAGTSGFTFLQGTSGGFANVTISSIPVGSAIIPGSYYRLLINTTGPQFIQLFWFTVNGLGSMPVVGYDVAVQINFLSTQTAAQVATQLAVNANGLFQVPDVRGYFIRGWDNGSGHDTGASTRTGSGFSGSGNTGDEIGSFQVSGVGSHTHISSSGQVFATLGGTPAADGVTASGVTRFVTSTLSNITGTVFPSQGDTRPPNVYFNGFIKT